VKLCRKDRAVPAGGTGRKGKRTREKKKKKKRKRERRKIVRSLTLRYSPCPRALGGEDAQAHQDEQVKGEGEERKKKKKRKNPHCMNGKLFEQLWVSLPLRGEGT